MEKKEVKKVCVTGAASYLGSSLVKKLLERGYTVHATLRNLGDESKVGILKGLRNAERILELFEADLYNGDEFGKAIEGCEIVVHMATPLQHNSNNSSQVWWHFQNTSKKQPELPLRFCSDGTFKILQVADLHYGTRMMTQCRDMLETEFEHCSDLNTTLFLKRMFESEKPNFIAFTRK